LAEVNRWHQRSTSIGLAGSAGWLTASSLKDSATEPFGKRTGLGSAQKTLGNVRLALGRAEYSEYVRLNIANMKYVGSDIVGDANGRFFEPAPGRN
jgi:hypothetical protein